MEIIYPWLAGSEEIPQPSRQALAQAVRNSLAVLAQDSPGSAVEVRIPPYAAVQCISGPVHTRGTPPNVVEAPPKLWLQLVCGILPAALCADGNSRTIHIGDDPLAYLDPTSLHQKLTISGSRALEVVHLLPLVSFSSPH